MKPQACLPEMYDTPSTVELRPAKANPVKVEIDRLNGKKLRVLEYLKAHGSALNYELSAADVGGLGGVRRVWELEQMGYDIEKTKVGGGVWRYTLKGYKGMVLVSGGSHG